MYKLEHIEEECVMNYTKHAFGIYHYEQKKGNSKKL
jgi:hypothetical protein